MNVYYVYILASRKKGALYVGMAEDLKSRVFQHKNEVCDGFTSKYKVKKLVYYEKYDDKKTAVMREKKLKKWNRAWKVRLIEKKNPDWEDIFSELGC